MGRTVKISELKKFDVFSWMGTEFIFIDKIHFICPTTLNIMNFNENEQEEEVELLGRMEFIRTGP